MPDEQNKELETVKAELAEIKAKMDAAQQSGNAAALSNHALRAVLKAHNIAFDVDKADLTALSVGEDGAVSGEFAYTPPAVQNQQQAQQQAQEQQAQQQPQQQPQGLTIEDVKAMSEDQINERWDEVSKVLESQEGS